MTDEIDSELLSTLFTLEQPILKQVKAVVDDLSKDSKDQVKLSVDESLFYSAIINTLRTNHKKMIPPNEGRSLTPRIKGFDYGVFRNAFNRVNDLLDTEVGDCKKKERIRFYRLVSDSVYEYQRSCVKETKTISELHELIDFLQEEIKIEEKEAFLKTLFKAKKQLEGRKPALGIKAMLEGLQQADDAIEAAFPGYLSNGFLHVVVKSTETGWSEG